MGCKCDKASLDKDKEKEINPGRLQYLSKTFKETAKLMHVLTKCQAKMRGLNIRKKYRDMHVNQAKFLPNSSINKFSIVSSTKITDEDIRILFQQYPPLNDNTPVSLRSCVQYENQALYYGEWTRDTNIRHGRGIQYWADGSRYEGYWKHDKANNQGKLYHSDGDVYEGEWLDDKAHGYGIYTHIDGSQYKGYWRDDRQEGKGIEIWTDGARYEGNYSNGIKSGIGKFYWADNSTFEGEFKDNAINGKGIYYWSDGRQYAGDWMNNKMHGQGVFTWSDGKKYTGEFINDIKEGFGCFEWPNGSKFKGQWVKGKQNGEGELYNETIGRWRRGIWENGKRIQWFDGNDN